MTLPGGEYLFRLLAGMCLESELNGVCVLGFPRQTSYSSPAVARDSGHTWALTDAQSKHYSSSGLVFVARTPSADLLISSRTILHVVMDGGMWRGSGALGPSNAHSTSPVMTGHNV
jgi:hypothetical protein